MLPSCNPELKILVYSCSTLFCLTPLPKKDSFPAIDAVAVVGIPPPPEATAFVIFPLRDIDQ